ncbi:hypothetical protein CQA53_00230 [Helicobacter didelphidarum]|uniref:HTH tetR-type domain-containing protein n=1 Tax=Helicobacter didelphidarum TaxID=2040648 RepID=A0A3D8ISA6_9HELI|nr:TetR family transcriptional regulator [Helicobacter didelphidarum]RDU67494.1 hypothetical protein CQA53_00230 [Helicobacter didelphidarum]
MAKNSKKAIIVVATELFSAKGYEATSTREITQKANVNLSMIAYYFKNKEGLYRAILEECLNPILDFINESEKQGLSPIAFLESYTNFIQSHLQKIPIFLFMNEFGRPKHFTQDILQRYTLKVHTFFGNLLQKGIEQGDFRSDINITYTLIAFVGMLNFYVVNKKAIDTHTQNISETNETDYFAHVYEILLHGIKNNAK